MPVAEPHQSPRNSPLTTSPAPPVVFEPFGYQGTVIIRSAFPRNRARSTRGGFIERRGSKPFALRVGDHATARTVEPVRAGSVNHLHASDHLGPGKARK